LFSQSFQPGHLFLHQFLALLTGRSVLSMVSLAGQSLPLLLVELGSDLHQLCRQRGVGLPQLQ
jgi:hypothetical protein